MKQFIINNFDKICIGFSSIFLFEIFMRYYNLKYYHKYLNLKIKNEKIYQIEMYEKKNIYNPLYNSLYNPLYPIFKNSLTIVIKNNDTDYKIYNNIRFIKPINYLYYDNNKIFYIIISNLYKKKDCQKFLDIVKQNKNDHNIKYKIIKSRNTYCLYFEQDNLVSICDNKNDLLIKICGPDINYIVIFLLSGIIIYYNK